MTVKPNARLRKELEEAIAKVHHQIEIQYISNHYVGSRQMQSA
jgi:hypothetical protein